MIKRLLKKIFPIVLLKKTFLIVNTIKVNVFDNFIFPEYTPLKEEIILDTESSPFEQFNIDELSDETVRKYMECWKNWKDQEKAFASIREDLAHLYSLSYYPQPNPNRGWRTITVRLRGENGKKYRIRTRSGYRPKTVRIAGQMTSRP